MENKVLDFKKVACINEDFINGFEKIAKPFSDREKKEIRSNTLGAGIIGALVGSNLLRSMDLERISKGSSLKYVKEVAENMESNSRKAALITGILTSGAGLLGSTIGMKLRHRRQDNNNK
jgi:hypothetical protein